MIDSLDSFPSSAIFEVENYEVLSVKGEDRAAFLHGQLTVDINAMPTPGARRSAHCDNKGKAWSVLQVIRLEDRFLLVSNREALDATQAQLQKYGVFSKIALEKHAECKAFLATGAAASTICDALFPDLAENPFSVSENETGIAVRADYPQSAVWLYIDQANAQSLSTVIAGADIPQFGPTEFNALAIQNGLPALHDGALGEYVPQMLNVQALSGIDFKKGCYMGQEVVARTRYLGKNKRAAYVLKTAEPVSITPGDDVERQLGENWRRAGAVIRSASLGKESWLLAVLPNDIGVNDVLRLASSPEVPLEIQPLPYTIESDDKNSILKR